MLKIEPGLYQNESSGNYFAQIRRKGNLYYQNLETDSRSIARRKLAEFRLEIEKLASGKLLAEHCIELYREKMSGQEESTKGQRESLITRFVEMFKGREMSSMTKEDCESFLSKWKNHARHKQGKTFLRQIFKIAKDKKAVSEIVPDEIENLERNDILRLIPRESEFIKIVETMQVEFPDSADWLEFQGRAGLGQAEVLGITKRNVNWERNRIENIKRRKTKKYFEIPIYTKLRPILERMLEKRKDDPMDTPLFEKYFDLRKPLKRICKALDYPLYTERAFRRMFITDALDKKIDARVVAKTQGHSTPKLVLEIYSDVRAELLDDMAGKM